MVSRETRPFNVILCGYEQTRGRRGTGFDGEACVTPARVNDNVTKRASDSLLAPTSSLLDSTSRRTTISIATKRTSTKFVRVENRAVSRGFTSRDTAYSHAAN